MNLDQITTKCWILALFIRDDGERLLLGDGWYDFKDSLQHFQPNNIASDIVELQGTDGQLLAGQVRRTASQSFDGYVGDALTSKTEIENRRRQFIQFFRVRRFYTVIYIFPDGTAIQRKRGYLTDAPSVPEMWQKFPEYHVALNFEDVNYYEYSEDEQGREIYANTALIELLNLGIGGLVWDSVGAVSHGYTWLEPVTLTGDYITISDGLDSAPLTLQTIYGNAEQTTYSGKNLLPIRNTPRTINGVTFTPRDDGSVLVNGTATAQTSYPLNINSTSQSKNVTLPAGTYTIDDGSTTQGVFVQVWYDEGGGNLYSITTFTTTAETHLGAYIRVNSGVTANNVVMYPMLNSGSTAQPYERYVGGTPAPNPEFPQPISTVTGEQTVKVEGKNLCEGLSAGYYDITSKALIDTSSTRFRGFKVAVDSGTYTMSCNTKINVVRAFTDYDHSSNVIFSGTQTNVNSFTMNVTQATTLYMSFRRNDNTDWLETDSIQLEVGSQATSYEPFTSQSQEINLGSIELAKIGTYQDRIYKNDGKWYIEKQTGKVVLDGTETWVTASDQNTGDTFYATSPSLDSFLPTGASDCKSNNFPTITGIYGGDSVGIQISSAAAYKLKMRILKTALSTVDIAGWKSWLSTHPTTVYYALATPTTTEITDETLLEQLEHIYSLYEGVNHISITPTAGAQGTMEVKYYTVLDTTGAGYEWEPGGGSSTTTVQVNGVDNAEPIWTVTGPATNPTLTNITTGQAITWNGTVPAGQTLVVDMGNQSATLAGANVYQFISGSWITLSPGPNKLSYSATGGAEAASKLEWNGVVG